MITNAPAIADRPRYYRLAAAVRELYPFPCHPASATRHITTGVKLRDGSTLKLAAVRTPAGWLVTREGVEAFFAALTADRTGGPARPATPNARVEAELNAAGF